MKITGVYLAAGNSNRMGINKLALPLGNKEMGRWGLEKAVLSELNDIIIVSNHLNHLDLSGFNSEKIITVEIKEPEAGQSHSLQTGIRSANNIHSDAVVILLADQPFITTNMINKLIEIYKRNPNYSFVASSFHGCIRPPILIDKDLFSDIHLLRGDRGARKILMAKREQGILVPFHVEKRFVDIDNMEEYLFWKNKIDNN